MKPTEKMVDALCRKWGYTEKVRDEVEKMGGQVKMGVEVTKIKHEDFKITGGGAPSDRSAVPKEEMGGYSSWLEFANKDPKGYAAQHKKDAAQSIQIGVTPETA